MAVIRWNPWNELFDLHSHMDELFQTLNPDRLRAFGSDRDGFSHLPVDIRQTEDAFLVEASVPGLEPEDVNVTFDGGVLTITGTSRAKDEDGEETYVRRERGTTSVFRQISLPTDIRPEEISAAFVNGELIITLPRAKKASPMKIPVTSNGTRDAESPQRIVEHQPD
ncbi:MAG TPA: Hsp20/alpha crystallin family protein [Candidatus Dormibacteraeota bacterium]